MARGWAGRITAVSRRQRRKLRREGLFWHAAEVFEDFILLVERRISVPEDNSGMFVRAPALTDTPQPAIETRL
jgi:hypothetical protein